MNKYAGLGLGLSAGLPIATASYFLSGMFDKKDKHSLARAIGSILLGTAAGFGANKMLGDVPLFKLNVDKLRNSVKTADYK